MTLYEQLEGLVASFHQNIQLAKELESANPEDDLESKLAVVGFSYNSPTQEWAIEHFNFVKTNLYEEFQDGPEPGEYGENSENVRLFLAMALGYLLGLSQQGLIDDTDFRIAERHTNALIMLHLEKITSQPA